MALFLGAIALFVVYYLKQKKYDREDKASPYASAHQFYYGKDPGSGGPASVTTSNHSYMLPQYTAEYKPHVGAAISVSETPEPLPSEYSSNAEYYDRLEGKTRGRPLMTISPPMQITAAVDSNHQQHQEQVDTIGQLPTDSLPTHPAYIPRSSSRSSHRATPQPGARPSRSATPLSRRSSTQSSSFRPQHNSASNSNSGSGSGNKPDSYAIQVYLNAAEDPKVPQPPPPVAAPSWSSRPPSRAVPASNAEIARNIQIELASAQPTPPTSAGSIPQGGGRATPATSFQSQQQYISRTTSLDQTTDAGGGSPLPPPPRIGSLILPSVPRIRVPGSKKLPPRLEVPDGAGAGISGPLAFPDSRFSTRPPPPPVQGQTQAQDRIVEQTVDRVGRSMEVPIASGKSYLYG